MVLHKIIRTRWFQLSLTLTRPPAVTVKPIEPVDVVKMPQPSMPPSAQLALKQYQKWVEAGKPMKVSKESTPAAEPGEYEKLKAELNKLKD